MRYRVTIEVPIVVFVDAESEDDAEDLALEHAENRRFKVNPWDACVTMIEEVD